MEEEEEDERRGGGAERRREEGTGLQVRAEGNACESEGKEEKWHLQKYHIFLHSLPFEHSSNLINSFVLR